MILISMYRFYIYIVSCATVACRLYTVCMYRTNRSRGCCAPQVFLCELFVVLVLVACIGVDSVTANSPTPPYLPSLPRYQHQQFVKK
jgi:hypothetical protein